MPQVLKILLPIILCASFTACTSIQFSEEELKLMKNISSQLDGVEVGLIKGITSNTEEGTYKKLEITINEPNFDGSNIELYALFMKSIPALMVVQSKIPNLSDYKYLYITINSKKIAENSIRYSISELKQVEACIPMLNGYSDGLQHLNRDSLQFYTDPGIFNRLPLDSLISSLQKFYSTYGKPRDRNFQGFKIATYNGERVFVYTVVFPLAKNKHVVDISINPKTKKVVHFSY